MTESWAGIGKFLKSALSLRAYIQDLRLLRDAITSRNDEQFPADVELFLPALRVIILPVFLLWVVSFLLLLVAAIVGDPDAFFWGPFGDSFNIINSLLSGLAFGAIALSLFLQRAELKATLRAIQLTNEAVQSQSSALGQQLRYLKFDRDRNIREFASTFSSTALKDARSSAYILRAPFFTNADFRAALADQWVCSEDFRPSAEHIQLVKDCNRGRVPEEEIERLKNHTWHLSDLIEYYATMYRHCYSMDEETRMETARALGGQYLWHYWRGMLLLFAFEVAGLYDREVTNEARQQFPKPRWIGELVEFDKWAMEHKYRPNTHPRETVYGRVDTSFSMNYLEGFISTSDGCAPTPEGR